MSGSQVSQPNFVGVPQTNMANTDVAGIYNNAFNQQMQIAGQQNASNNAMIGGAVLVRHWKAQPKFVTQCRRSKPNWGRCDG
jgi:hypothetical protein